MALTSVEEAIKDFQDGKMVIIVDDEDRENEGDLAVAAEKVTPEIINFMATHGRGLICAPIIAQRLEQLKLPIMVDDNTSRNTTAFTVSIDVRKGATTRHLGLRPLRYNPVHDRPHDRAGGPGEAGPHLPPALSGGGSPSASRPDGGIGGPVQAGGSVPRRRYL